MSQALDSITGAVEASTSAELPITSSIQEAPGAACHWPCQVVKGVAQSVVAGLCEDGSAFMEAWVECRDCLTREGQIVNWDFFQDAFQDISYCSIEISYGTITGVALDGEVQTMTFILSITSPAGMEEQTKIKTTTSGSPISLKTTSPTSTTAEPEGDTEQPPSTSQSRAWIAGPVIASVLGAIGIIVTIIFLGRRQRRKRMAKDTAAAATDQHFDKAQLHADSISRKLPAEASSGWSWEAGGTHIDTGSKHI